MVVLRHELDHVVQVFLRMYARGRRGGGHEEKDTRWTRGEGHEATSGARGRRAAGGGGGGGGATESGGATERGSVGDRERR